MSLVSSFSARCSACHHRYGNQFRTAWQWQWGPAPSRFSGHSPCLTKLASHTPSWARAGTCRVFSTGKPFTARSRWREVSGSDINTEQEVKRAQTSFQVLREKPARHPPRLALKLPLKNRLSIRRCLVQKPRVRIRRYLEHPVSIRRHLVSKYKLPARQKLPLEHPVRIRRYLFGKNGIPERQKDVPLQTEDGVTEDSGNLKAAEQAASVNNGIVPSRAFCYTPSDAVIASLGTLSRLYITYKDFSNKVDLSHTSPVKIALKGRKHVGMHAKTYSSRKYVGQFYPNIRTSLQRLLAEYMRWCWPVDSDAERGPQKDLFDDRGIRSVFSEDNIAFIRSQGYGPEDLISWAWILTARSTDRAVWRLKILTADVDRPSHMSKAVPTFLYLFMLRRKHWNPHELRMMIVHGWDILGGRISTQPAQNITKYIIAGARAFNTEDDLRVAEKDLVIMVIRLLRLARKAWPEACVSIAAMLTKHERVPSVAPHKLPPVARLTFLYNKILAQLALPASMCPFLSVPAQQKAQFDVLRRMNEFDPPLAIDREGYRAVTRVQLAQKKTLQERDWALLKAKSWPPWKEEKLGIDAEKGPQYGISGASRVRTQLKAAGYAALGWEAAAEIYAGWDTDRSPTIQRRVVYSRPIASHRQLLKESRSDVLSNVDAWSARVQATRTVDEAWACFLAYKDEMSSLGLPAKSPAVFFAMAEKLIFDDIRSRVQKVDVSTSEGYVAKDAISLPGDGKEVFEKPSPREALFVRSSPPSLDIFFNMIHRNQIPLSPRFLAMLLTHARSFKMGIHHLNSSMLPRAIVQDLLVGDLVADNSLNDEIVPPYLFAALIVFLSRFAQQVSHGGLPTVRLTVNDQTAVSSLPRINPLVRAYLLVTTYKPYYRPPWNAVLAALARDGVSLENFSRSVDDRVQGILAWKAILSLVRRMYTTGLSPDLAGFYHICNGYKKAIVASEALTDSPDVGYVRQYLGADPKGFLNDGLSFIKGLFSDIVFEQTSKRGDANTGKESPAVDYLLPRLLETPNPAQLHAFIRLLGSCKDYEGLVRLVEWMGRFNSELQAKAQEAMNGKRMLRRCLTAAWVFLEPSWPSVGEDPYDCEARDDTGSKDNSGDISDAIDLSSVEAVQKDSAHTYIERFRRIIDENPNWGGWPSEEELELYISKDRANVQ